MPACGGDMKVEIITECCFCMEEVKRKIEIPENWGVCSEEIYIKGLCPKHKVIQEFLNNQCVGCVCVWLDCPLWKAIKDNG